MLLKESNGHEHETVLKQDCKDDPTGHGIRREEERQTEKEI